MESLLLQFDTFSQAQMIFLSILFFTLLYGAARLRSVVGVTSWAFTGIALIGVMEFNLDILYLWFSVILAMISLAVAMLVNAIYR